MQIIYKTIKKLLLKHMFKTDFMKAIMILCSYYYL